MELEICVSQLMTRNEKEECGLVRIPKEYRDKNNYEIGEFIYLRKRTGDLEVLQVANAYKEDIDSNKLSAYVTAATHKKLFMRSRCVSEVHVIENITLGCDPEALLINKVSGEIIPAFRFFDKNDDAGHDGQLIEFRPAPSIHAEEVCSNIWCLIKKARNTINRKTGVNNIIIHGCSSYSGATAGFHLHYGLPHGMLGRRPDVRRAAQLMTSIFDYYVGIPSIIPEGNNDVTRRTKKFIDYGKPGGFNLDNRTFEFRLPGGINLVHPLLARGLMALGAIVAEDVASRINTCTDFFTNMKEVSCYADVCTLYPHIPDIATFYSVICNPDIGPARYHFEIIKEDIRKMIGYAKRAAAVEQYFDFLNNGITFGNNIELNWGGFYNEKQQGQMVVL